MFLTLLNCRAQRGHLSTLKLMDLEHVSIRCEGLCLVLADAFYLGGHRVRRLVVLCCGGPEFDTKTLFSAFFAIRVQSNQQLSVAVLIFL
jgi:hypothetical protein